MNNDTITHNIPTSIRSQCQMIKSSLIFFCKRIEDDSSHCKILSFLFKLKFCVHVNVDERTELIHIYAISYYKSNKAYNACISIKLLTITRYQYQNENHLNIFLLIFRLIPRCRWKKITKWSENICHEGRAVNEE